MLSLSSSVLKTGDEKLGIKTMSSHRRRRIIFEISLNNSLIYDSFISQALSDTSAERKNICSKVHRGQGVEAFIEFLCQGWIYRSHRRTKDLGAIEASVHRICIESQNHRASSQWERRTVINFIPPKKMGNQVEFTMNSLIFQMPIIWTNGHCWPLSLAFMENTRCRSLQMPGNKLCYG